MTPIRSHGCVSQCGLRRPYCEVHLLASMGPETCASKWSKMRDEVGLVRWLQIRGMLIALMNAGSYMRWCSSSSCYQLLELLVVLRVVGSWLICGQLQRHRQLHQMLAAQGAICSLRTVFQVRKRRVAREDAESEPVGLTK